MDKWWTNELPVVLAPCHMVTQVNYLNIMYQVQTSESPHQSLVLHRPSPGALAWRQLSSPEAPSDLQAPIHIW